MKYKIGDNLRINIRGCKNEAGLKNDGSAEPIYEIDPGANGQARQVNESTLDAIVLMGADIYHEELVEDESDDLVELGAVKPGMTVRVGDLDLIVLDTTFVAEDLSRSVFCLTKDILFNKEFDEGNNNNWEKSSLRKYLNSEFRDEFAAKIGSENLLPFDRDLTSDDGLKDYGTCVDYVSLISDDEYRHYRKYIKNKSNWWWTLTPYSTLPDYTSYARYVDTDGSRSYDYAYFGSRGVSPAFSLLPSLKVRIVEDTEE